MHTYLLMSLSTVIQDLDIAQNGQKESQKSGSSVTTVHPGRMELFAARPAEGSCVI